jgi:hypothetical protein
MFHAGGRDTSPRSARAEAATSLGTVILSLEESPDLDSTRIEALREFAPSMQLRALLLARVKDHVRDVLRRAQVPFALDRWLVGGRLDATRCRLCASRARAGPRVTRRADAPMSTLGGCEVRTGVHRGAGPRQRRGSLQRIQQQPMSGARPPASHKYCALPPLGVLLSLQARLHQPDHDPDGDRHGPLFWSAALTTFGGAGRSRTDLHGFAIRCITALLPRHVAGRILTQGEKRRRTNGPRPLQPSIKKGSRGFPWKIWSGKRGSNSRPQPWQGCALPTELFPLGRFIEQSALSAVFGCPTKLAL